MKRYKSTRDGGARICLFKDGQHWWPLIKFGDDDLKIGEVSDKSRSTSTERFNDYEHDEIEYPLTGGISFTPQRFVVIQMQ